MTIDKTFLIPDFKKGCIYRKDPDVIRCGGKGANVARAFSKFSRDYILMGFCCGWTGRLIMEYLKEEGLKSIVVYQKDGESRVCISVVDRCGVSTDINEEGPFIKRSSLELFLDRFKRISKRMSSLVICGRIPRGVSYYFFKEIFEIAKKEGADIYVDVASDMLFRFIELGCETVKINAFEFREISGLPNSEKNIFDFYKKYSRNGLKSFIVTDKGDKTIAVFNGRILRVFPPKMEGIISGVGAGDSFMAGLVWSKIQGFDESYSLKLATAFASSDLLTAGAGSITKKDVRRYLNRVVVEEVK